MVVAAFTMPAMIVARFALAARNTGVTATVVTVFAMPAMIVARFTLAARDTGVTATVVTAFAMPAMIVARFALAARNTGVTATVVATLTMPAMVITGLAFAAGDTGVTAPVVTALVMPAMIISARHRRAVAATSVVAALTDPMPAAIVVPTHRPMVGVASPNGVHGRVSAIHGSGHGALTHDPGIHASLAAAHPHPRKAPAIGFAGAARKQR
jgi:hypothetical protein